MVWAHRTSTASQDVSPEIWLVTEFLNPSTRFAWFKQIDGVSTLSTRSDSLPVGSYRFFREWSRPSHLG
jgi:hypothetical protein